MLRESWWTDDDIFHELSPSATSIEIDFWPLYLSSLLGALIYISELYFRSDANCEEIFFSPQRQKRLVAFEHDNCLKTTI